MIASIDVPHLGKEAMQSWEHRALRRGHLFAGTNVLDDGRHEAAVSASTGKTVNWIQLL